MLTLNKSFGSLFAVSGIEEKQRFLKNNQLIQRNLKFRCQFSCISHSLGVSGVCHGTRFLFTFYVNLSNSLQGISISSRSVYLLEKFSIPNHHSVFNVVVTLSTRFRTWNGRFDISESSYSSSNTRKKSVSVNEYI